MQISRSGTTKKTPLLFNIIHSLVLLFTLKPDHINVKIF